MSNTLFIDCYDPQINLIKESKPHAQECVLMEILVSSGTKILLHFNTQQDLKAFIGLQVLAVEGKYVEPDSSTNERLRKT